jgi:hypothetical protein
VTLFPLEGESRAYPLRGLTWHEIVNDEVGRGLPGMFAVEFMQRFGGLSSWRVTVGGGGSPHGKGALLMTPPHRLRPWG